MDTSMLFLAIPVFLVVFAGAELLFGNKRPSWSIGNRTSHRASWGSVRDFSRTIGETGINRAILGIKSFHQRLDNLLLRSGYPNGWKAEDLLFYKELSVVLCALLLWAVRMDDVTIWLLGLLLSFWAFDIALQMRGGTRKADMQRALPAFVDLMALLIESGLDLMVAIERIYARMKASALREELQVLLQESRLGASRKDMLQRWAHRTGLADAQSLASLIIQSEEMGTPLANVLRSYAEDMRVRRALRGEEQAGKIPVKILFPMMVFFFPIVFVIILGPVALEFLKGYK